MEILTRLGFALLLSVALALLLAWGWDRSDGPTDLPPPANGAMNTTTPAR